MSRAWKRIIRICKAHGLNHIRFHSWCPPEAAFIAADELGFYYQVECPSWANQGAAIGEGRPLDQWLFQEGWRMLADYGNHPSFLLLAYGNEPAGRMAEFLARLGDLLAQARPAPPLHGRRRLADAPGKSVSQHFCARVSRLWGAGLTSRINALPPETTHRLSRLCGAGRHPRRQP